MLGGKMRARCDCSISEDEATSKKCTITTVAGSFGAAWSEKVFKQWNVHILPFAAGCATTTSWILPFYAATVCCLLVHGGRRDGLARLNLRMGPSSVPLLVGGMT